MPIVIRYVPSSLTREQYDKVNEILQENGPDPAGGRPGCRPTSESQQAKQSKPAFNPA